jgi:hypothetical protein
VVASLPRIADFSTECFWISPAGDDCNHPHDRNFKCSGIELRVNTEFSHSVHEGGSVDTQAARSSIRTTDAAPTCRKSLYNFLPLLPFILVGGSVVVRSRTACFANRSLLFRYPPIGAAATLFISLSTIVSPLFMMRPCDGPKAQTEGSTRSDLSQFFSTDSIILRTISGLATAVTMELMPTFAWFGA